MDLLCTENVNISDCENLFNPMEVRVNKALQDPTFLDDRCLENLLKSEEKHGPIGYQYFQDVQKDITPSMRKLVADWIIEVSRGINQTRGFLYFSSVF